MALVTAILMTDRGLRTDNPGTSLQRLFWTRRTSLTGRILTVNILALALLAGSLFYLDSFRKQLLTERSKLARSEAQITAEALVVATWERQQTLLVQLGKEQKLRLRIYNPEGELLADSFKLAEPSFTLADPTREPWYQNAARLLDRGMDALVGAPPIPAYVEPADTSAQAWPELVRARQEKRSQIVLRYAPDRTPIITAAAPMGTEGAMLLTNRNAPDITERVRNARQTLAIIIGIALVVSIQLSLFLARTIVLPLRVLVRAAVRVRLGRDRDVEVPRMPERRDEIGLLARAISDMTAALRHRIDAVESFAADVSHEIKNPLASLRSALESLERVTDPALREQLTSIALHDLRRIDRLITEIADASKIDAELSRATFEPFDIGALVTHAVAAREGRHENEGHHIELEHLGARPAMVTGVPARIERIIENLLDNAVSFSPPNATIAITITANEEQAAIMVCDEGSGIPAEEREHVFERFHSIRPEAESFGNHSGLGLAIARSIAEAHGGTMTAQGRSDGRSGACLVLTLPRHEAE